MRHKLLGCLALAGLVVPVVACDNSASRVTDDGSATAVSESNPYLYDSLEIGGREATSVRILGSPDWLTADDEHVYVMRDEGGFNALDPETAEVVSSFDIDGQRCQGLGAAAGAVWTCAGSDLIHVDPSTGEVQATVPVTKAAEQGHLVVAFGRVWVLLGDGTSLLGIDAENNSSGDPIDLPIRGTDLAVSGDRIWVVSGVDNAAVEVNPQPGTVGRRIDGLTGARAAVAIPGALWVGGTLASYRVDVATGSVTATVGGGIGNDGGISGDDSGIWVRKGGLTLQHLDATTGTVREEISADISEVLGRGGDILVAFGAIWVTFYDDATLLRIPLS